MTSKPGSINSVTRTGSTTTSAPGRSAAASACSSLRKPRTIGGEPPSCSKRNGSGAIPIPPPTSSGRSTSSRKPCPSGPSAPISSPTRSSPIASVPGPIGSTRNASSPGGARQSENGRGSSRPGASSMKNCPGTPGSRPPRSSRSSVYGPTRSERVTLCRVGDAKLRIDPFLERDGLLGPRRGDRVHGGGGARQRRDARDAAGERGLADGVAVRPRVATLGSVDHEVATAAPDEVDDRRLVVGRLTQLPHRLDGDPGGDQRRRGSFGRVELEPEADERRGDRRPAARSALSSAVERSAALAITSPVERISGPSTGSLPGKRANGRTAAFTLHCRGGRSGGSPSSGMGVPTASRHAALTSSTPVALLTNGTVRDARGFTSSTYTSPSPVTASWTLRRPTAPSAFPRIRTTRAISCPCANERLGAGSTQAESPEWTPASSTCCMTAATYVSVPSQSASTSTSTAFSTKRSTRTLANRGISRTSSAV